MLKLSIEPHEEFILVFFSGLVSVEAWGAALKELEARLETLEGNRLVLDLMGLLGYLGVPERTAVGALMATHLRRMRRVALAVHGEKITNVVRSEAGRGGLTLCLFTNLDEAVSWAVAQP
jgi:hypothetical protein